MSLCNLSNPQISNKKNMKYFKDYFQKYILEQFHILVFNFVKLTLF